MITPFPEPGAPVAALDAAALEAAAAALAASTRLIEQLTARGIDLLDENARLQRELARERACRAVLVARNALLRQRPDLPVDRIPAYRELVRLQGEMAVAREALRDALQALAARGAFA